MSKIINKNIICPRCFSNELYRFGKDKNGYQKYQCKICKRQFVPDAKPRKLKGYPRCPKCGKGTFIHHNYKYFVRIHSSLDNKTPAIAACAAYSDKDRKNWLIAA